MIEDIFLINYHCPFFKIFFLLTVLFLLNLNQKEKIRRLTMANPLKKVMGHDLKMAEKGVWVPVPGMEEYGSKVLIAKHGNKNYEDYVKKLNKPYLKTLRFGQSIPDSVVNENINKATATHIILNWENMPSDNHEEIYNRLFIEDESESFTKKTITNPDAWVPYSVKTAYEWLSDPELEAFKEFVLSMSLEREIFQIQKDNFEES